MHEGPDRQPRRNRRARHPRVPRDGPRDRRRLLRLRSHGAARAAAPTRRTTSARARRARATCASTRSSTSRDAPGATLVHPGLRIPRRERGLRAGVRRRRPDVRRAVAGRHRADGQQDRGARRRRSRPACRSCPAPKAPFGDDAPDAEIAAEARAHRLSAASSRRSPAAAARACAPSPTPGDLLAAVRTARSEAGSAFGDTRRLPRAPARSRPRHIEIQLLGDHARHRAAVRRARVLDSAAPSEGRRRVAVAGARRRTRAARMAECAARVARAVGYTNAGTIEFLLDEDGQFYFLEMNTRLQVEHPVTEMVTGIDLVQWQLRIAQGERLTIDARARARRRARTRSSAASTPRIPTSGSCRRPGSSARSACPAARASATTAAWPPGFEVPVFYDSMIAKLVVWGDDARRGHRAAAPRARRIPRASASRRRCRSSGG